MDKQILLEGIDLLEFFGVNNSKIELIKRLFPKIKITARGHALFVQGEPKEIKAFEKKFALILDHYYQYNMLSEEIIHELLNSGVSSIEENGSSEPDIIVFGNSGKPVRARTPNQRRLVESNSKNDLIFAIGPAGTGKTYTAIALAVRALKNKEIKKIILSRPAVEAGENLGFLPGDLAEKINPYLRPLYDALYDMLDFEKARAYIEQETIEIAPIAFMRGRTLNDSFVILDEAQNTTTEQMKMFLTRIGFNSKAVITGDITQIDLPTGKKSGLVEAKSLLQNIDGLKFVYFTREDVVRHRLVSRIIQAYERSTKKQRKK